MTPGGLMIAVILVALDGPDSQIIFVNPAEIVSIRAVREAHKEHFASHIQCMLQTVDGKVIAVVDECDEVRRRIGDRPDMEETK